ncbi:hypothetical protein PIROE2DRAFT_1917 [Piromyces sp. E2]|nr:hypothetical protein PIROE2DRAFT_1917 [Piromyces sp. E2]|eukprot:OUM69980.1 hypothetical protein PIROE2DRAFT_1917 [Piromyces sp. E2]
MVKKKSMVYQDHPLKILVNESYIAPETEIEKKKKLGKIYSEIFNILANEIEQMNDFYELGRDSLNHYNIIFQQPLNINNNVDIEKKIKLAFEKILQNHEILKSQYHEKEVDGKIEIYGFINDVCS